MANVIATFKIFPTDVTIDLGHLRDQVKACLPNDSSVYKFEEEPIAFGLVAVVAHILVPEEKTGRIDEVENALKKLENVGEIQTVMVRRV